MARHDASSVSEAMRSAINDQIREELDSAYLYLGLSAYMDGLNLKGCAHWLRMQWQEETQHALKFFDFLLQRDCEVELKALAAPAFSAKTPLEVFELVLAHERHITACIHELYALAVLERDYASQTLLQWFITEQLEEEQSARDIIDDLRLAGDSGASLFLLDREFAARQAEE